jgi:hypothetical protein
LRRPCHAWPISSQEGDGDLHLIDGLPITQRELLGYQNIVALAPDLTR